ncbi:hypothetical protein C9422_03325 [Pseudomonas sp. B1(2018)]|nr:hypothetical protein C9422_03325 [Pseudomonas sp. B1(2018)]
MFCGECTGLFAGKPAPTGDLCRSQIQCGSGLAREGGITDAATSSRHGSDTPQSPAACAHPGLHR